MKTKFLSLTKIVNYISNLLSKTVALGCNQCQNTTEIRIVKMLNLQSLTVVGVFLFSLVRSLIFGMQEYQGFLVICLICIFAILFMNSKGYFVFARIIFLAVCNASVFQYSVLYGKESLLYLIFIPLFSTPFSLFSDRRRYSTFWTCASLFVSAGCFIYFALGDVPAVSVSAEFVESIRRVSVFIVILGAISQPLDWLLILHNNEKEVLVATRNSEKRTKELLEKEVELTSQLAVAKTRIEIAMKVLKFGVWEWNYQEDVYYCDEQMHLVLGIPREDFVSPDLVIAKSMVKADAIRLGQELQDTVKQHKDFSSEFGLVRADGSISTIRTAAKCFYDSHGKILKLVGANWDVTEARLQELRMIQSSKMSSLGEMSAGIAHEINNPLAIISGSIEQIVNNLEEVTPSIPSLKKWAARIDFSIERIAYIVRGLKTFARDGGADPFRSASVQNIVNETLAFCESRFLNNQIEILKKNISDSMILDCRSTQISQVLLNLLNNAFDAVILLQERWVLIEAKDEGECIDLSVTDSGRGIPKELQHKIMQPFFTTKEIGKGTGMGLSISNGLISSHYGSFGVDTSCENTRFFIRLPKIQKI